MKKIIFIGGAARSGTTLLDLILGNSSSGMSLGEVARRFRPIRSHHFDIKCACGEYPCPIWARLKDAKESNLYDRIFQDIGVDFIVDSSKNLPWIIDQNRRLCGRHDIHVYNLFSYKEPLSLFYSYYKRGNNDIKAIAMRYQYYERALRARLPFFTLNYDNFILDADEIIGTLCDRFGLDRTPNRVNFWEKTHHHLWGSFGPRKQLFSKKMPSLYLEKYTSEFESHRTKFEGIFRADVDIQHTLNRLKERDVLGMYNYDHSSISQIKRDIYYWKERLRERLKRCRPDPYPDKEASLIKIWNV